LEPAVVVRIHPGQCGEPRRGPSFPEESFLRFLSGQVPVLTRGLARINPPLVAFCDVLPPRSRIRALLFAALAVGATPAQLAAAPPSRTLLPPLPVQVDSPALHATAREAQAAFERERIRLAPQTQQVGGSVCDERIGRFCVRLDSEGVDDWTPPPEDPRLTLARAGLLDRLEQLAGWLPGDAWIVGQRVAYLGEAERWEEAVELARGCSEALGRPWWCPALRGMALHHLELFSQAEESFEEALAAMDRPMRERWNDPAPLVAPDLALALRRAGAEERRELSARLWTLADPFFLIPGNELWTEHLARRVLAELRSEARNPYSLRWGDDMTELLLRYGPEVAYQQEIPRGMHLGPIPMVGRLDPRSRHLLPTLAQVREPARIELGAWRTERRGAKSRHAPTFAPVLGVLDVQVAAFPQGDRIRFVLGWKIAGSQPPGAGAGAEGALLAGIFLIDAETLGERARLLPILDPGEGRGGVLLEVDPGDYLLSLEILAPEERLGWRARQGWSGRLAPPGVPVLSDLLLLSPSAPDPQTAPSSEGEGVHPSEDRDPLLGLLSRVLAGDQLEDPRIEIAWELSGMGGEDRLLRFTLSAEPVGRGLLRRMGEFLRLVPSQAPVIVRWQEGVFEGEDAGGGPPPLFRTLELDLSALPRGPVRIALEAEFQGRTPLRSERVVDLR